MDIIKQISNEHEGIACLFKRLYVLAEWDNLYIVIRTTRAIGSWVDDTPNTVCHYFNRHKDAEEFMERLIAIEAS